MHDDDLRISRPGQIEAMVRGPSQIRTGFREIRRGLTNREIPQIRTVRRSHGRRADFDRFSAMFTDLGNWMAERTEAGLSISHPDLDRKITGNLAK